MEPLEAVPHSGVLTLLNDYTNGNVAVENLARKAKPF